MNSRAFNLKLFQKSSVPKTPHEKRRSVLNNNQPKLSENIGILKSLETSIEKTNSNKITNITQLKMIHSTGIPSYLNYKRGKYKHKSLLEMSGFVPNIHTKKHSIISNQSQSNQMSPLNLPLFSLQ